MSSCKDIIKLKHSTGLPLTDCRTLSKTFGTPEQAIDFVESKKAKAVESAQRVAKLQSSPRNHWCIRDFLSREESELRSSGIRELVFWADRLKSYSERLHRAISPDFSNLNNIYDSANAALNEREALKFIYGIVWNAAMATHVVPRWESTWLSRLMYDPFFALRPLVEPRNAEEALVKYAAFGRDGETGIRSKYLANNLQQAEQYLLACDSTSVDTKPLLMYYAANCLTRAILILRDRNLVGKYSSHGLHVVDNTRTSLHQIQVEETAASGLYQAIISGLPGERLWGGRGPYTMIELCCHLPDLADTLVEYGIAASNCCRTVVYQEHSGSGAGLTMNFHLGPVLPGAFLRQIGVDIDTIAENHEYELLAQQVVEKLPDVIWKPATIDFSEPIQATYSGYLNDGIFALKQLAPSSHSQRRIFPVLYDGDLNGDWYVCYNGGLGRPNQLALWVAILYGLSMMVRYKPVEWKALLDNNDGSRSVVEELMSIGRVKLPILATEYILRRRVLGNLDRLPR